MFVPMGLLVLAVVALAGIYAGVEGKVLIAALLFVVFVALAIAGLPQWRAWITFFA